jgi:hypothetical protein
MSSENDPNYKWRPATRGDIGSIARFTNKPEEGWGYGLLASISNDPTWKYWPYVGVGVNGNKEPDYFKECQIQYDANKEP